MLIDFEAFIIMQIILDVVLIAALCSVEIRTKKAERRVQIMTAKSDLVPTDPTLIEEWVDKYKALPNGSPKWTAYRNRLFEVGYFKDGD